MDYSFYTSKSFTYSQGTFLERPNRFIAFVKYKDKVLRCHVPDPGRLKEILQPQATVLLRFQENNPTAKTDAGMIGVYLPNEQIWVSTDSQLASRCIRQTWQTLPVFKNYDSIKPEYTYGESRIDFLLRKDTGKEQCLAEVKTVGLKKEDYVGYFPDAPTKRGAKHVKELIKAAQEGYKSMIVFFVPRSDVIAVKPNKELDYDFYTVVKEAFGSGVSFLALKYDFTPNGVKFIQEIPFSVD